MAFQYKAYAVQDVQDVLTHITIKKVKTSSTYSISVNFDLKI